jgi:hypothetical protein
MQWQINGETYSEKYRYQCELRYIASMDLSGRRKYLGMVLEKRGVVALNKLKEGLEILWKNKKSKSQ